MQAQDIYDSYERQKRDLSDVGTTTFLEWVQFAVRFIYKHGRKVDPNRFVQSQSFSVVAPPQKETLPTNFRDMNPSICGLFKYLTRSKELVTFDETGDAAVTFTDSGGTSAYNTNVKIQGGSSRGYTGDAAATMLLALSTALNLESFADGGAGSPTNDFVSLWFKVEGTVPSSVTLEFSTTNDGSDVDTNEFQTAKTDIVEGWNRIKVAKSAFTTTGAPDWGSLAYVRLIHTGGDTTTNIYYDKLELLENEVNGKKETKDRIGITRYGSKVEGYYLEGSKIVFTHHDTHPTKADYVMKFMAKPPTINALTNYITLDASVTGEPIVEEEDMEYMIKAIDVLYEQWDVNPTGESLADFRFVRALGGILDGFNRQPQIAIIDNPANDF